MKTLLFGLFMVGCSGSVSGPDCDIEAKIVTAVQVISHTPCVEDGAHALRCGDYAATLSDDGSSADVYRGVEHSESTKVCIISCGSCSASCQVVCNPGVHWQ